MAKKKNSDVTSPISHTAEELSELMIASRVRDFVDKDLRKEFIKAHNLTEDEFMAMMVSSAAYVPNMSAMSIKKDSDITFEQLHDALDRVQVNFIIVRRVNYVLHQTMIEVYDYLEKYNKLRFTTKKMYLKAEGEWQRYHNSRRKIIEKSAFYTLQDHLRITYDFLEPRKEKVYEAVRDYLIRLGWKDIELKGRIEVVYLMYKMARSTFLAYFKDFYEETTVDFTALYAGDSMDEMMKWFVEMVRVLGIKSVKNERGYYELECLDSSKNQRVQWAWDDFINDMRDDDLMDESARKAIELNPECQKEYHQILEDSEKEQMDKEVDKLSEKFKVTKSK